MQLRILIADDSAQTREQLRQLLEADGSFQVDTIGDGRRALEALEREQYSFLLTDLRMPQVDGMQLIEHVHKQQLPVTAIVMTGFGSIDKAVQAMHLGAYDFLTKPIDIEHLKLVLKRAARERKLQDQVLQLRRRLLDQYQFQDILSKNPRMHAVFELIKNVAATTATVLIEGETGTGKELVARAIHEASRPARSGELVAVNCAALPENLLESELFGHEKGAFTGAATQRKGRFELAHRGTLFLDEVGDIPPAMQIKLLRVLQERRFERVGGTTAVEVDVRVIAATNRSLAQRVQSGEFREELYYRLNVVKIELPPLRDRLEDVPLLALHFAQKYSRPGELSKQILPAAMERLLRHSWPGNIRELENAIERACVTARGPNIEPGDLPLEELRPRGSLLGNSLDVKRPLPELIREMTEELERDYLQRALQKAAGNIGACARICGLSRRSVSAKLAQYQIDKAPYKLLPE